MFQTTNQIVKNIWGLSNRWRQKSRDLICMLFSCRVSWEEVSYVHRVALVNNSVEFGNS